MPARKARNTGSSQTITRWRGSAMASLSRRRVLAHEALHRPDAACERRSRAASDQNSVLITAFRKGDAYALHILNLGPARAVQMEGLPDGDWGVVETTETAQYQRKPALRSTGAALRFELPSRSLVTLISGAAASAGN